MYEDEHNVFRNAFRKFAEKEIAPHIVEWEKAGIIPRKVYLALGDSGFLCPWLDEKYGGSGADFLYSVIIAEEIMRVGAWSLLASLHSDINVPYIAHLASEEKKLEWLPKCASGEYITSIVMTEPGAGSDLASLRTWAERDGDHYVVNGSKIFISNGINMDLGIVACRTDRNEKGPKGVSLLAIEAATPGVKKGRKLEKMGLHAQDTAEIFFEECRVPVANLLGEEGKGFYYMMEHLQQERLIALIQCQGAAETMLDLTIAYAKERKAFGKPISSFQNSAFKIADMATEIKVGRAFTDDLIRKHMRGENVVTEVSMGKAWVCEMANRVAYQCVQLHGGYGYMDEYPISRFYRDIRPYTIFGGTTEVMKLIISKNLGLL